MDVPFLLVHNSRKETQAGVNNIAPPAIDSTIHNLINQLSVISLCCCELRNSLAEKLEADQLEEFNRIEITIQAAAETIQKLRVTVRENGQSESAWHPEKPGNDSHAVLTRFISR